MKRSKIIYFIIVAIIGLAPATIAYFFYPDPSLIESNLWKGIIFFVAFSFVGHFYFFRKPITKDEVDKTNK